MPDFQDAVAIDRVAEELCRRLVFGGETGPSWDAVTDRLAEVFPGSFATLLLHDHTENRSTGVVSGEMDEQAFSQYTDHYAAVNPWLPAWSKEPSGRVLFTETHFPAVLLKGNEFYEDWLVPLGNGESAVGLKLACGDDFLLHLPVHFRPKDAAVYGPALVAIMERIKNTLMMVAQSERVWLRMQTQATLEALCDYEDHPLFVTDLRGTLLCMNPQAERFVADGFALVRCGRLRLVPPLASVWLDKQFSAARRAMSGARWRAVFPFDADTCVLEFFLLPQRSTSFLYRDRVYAGLRIRRVSPQRHDLDRDLVRARFGLTLAESRLCDLLVKGVSLRDAADRLGLRESTVRSAAKRIFEKTSCSRQGQLVAVLSDYLREPLS